MKFILLIIFIVVLFIFVILIIGYFLFNKLKETGMHNFEVKNKEIKSIEEIKN